MTVPPLTADAAVVTNAVVASFVELSPVVCVGALGEPVNVGEANGARPTIAAAAVPEASNALEGCVAALLSPRFVRAVGADARSDRLFATAAAPRLVRAALAVDAPVPPPVTGTVARPGFG